MSDNISNLLPTGVGAIAALFLFGGGFLSIAGLLILLRPGLISMTVAAPLLFGLETAGPYMFLLTGILTCGIGWGLVRRLNIVRLVAILLAIAGIVMLVPPVSAAAAMIEPRALARAGTGIVVRVLVVWYLSRADVAGEFHGAK